MVVDYSKHRTTSTAQRSAPKKFIYINANAKWFKPWRCRSIRIRIYLEGQQAGISIILIKGSLLSWKQYEVMRVENGLVTPLKPHTVTVCAECDNRSRIILLIIVMGGGGHSLARFAITINHEVGQMDKPYPKMTGCGITQ